MNLDQLIETARLAYYKKDSAVELPIVHRWPSSALHIRPSGFACHQKHAYEKTGIGNPIPWLLPENNVAIADLFEQGSQMAELYQKALYYWSVYFGGDPETDDDAWRVQIEFPLISDDLSLSGQIDALVLTPNDEVWVVEMKYTMSGSKHDPGEPRYSHALQTLAYMMMVRERYPDRVIRGFVVTIGKGHASRKAYDVWELQKYGKGYRLYDTRNNEPLQVHYGDDWNQELHLSEDTIRAEIASMKQWIHAVTWGEVEAPYIADYDVHPKGWMCVDQKKATKRTPGYVAPRCPFAGQCHGVWETREIPYEETD